MRRGSLQAHFNTATLSLRKAEFYMICTPFVHNLVAHAEQLWGEMYKECPHSTTTLQHYYKETTRRRHVLVRTTYKINYNHLQDVRILAQTTCLTNM